MKKLKLAFLGGALSLAALSASAETFRWASNKLCACVVFPEQYI